MPQNPQPYLQATTEWLEKAVIGLNLCPFAKAPHNKGQIRIHVSFAKHLDAFLEDVDAEIRRLLDTPAETLETTLLVCATLFDDFLVFNDMLDAAEQAIEDNGATGIVQIAPFHPQFQFDGTEADDIGNYTNRSPYPTLHFIREDSIEKAAQAFPDPAVIFERNIETLQKMGLECWEKLVISGCPVHHNKESAS